MSDGSSFYITTPIFYVNDVPHIGHAYTEVAADVLARWHRQAGDDTWLLTGTDEHGQKILRTATANGTTPEGVGRPLVREEWLPLLETIDIANDDFIRTTDERHEKNVQLFLQKLYDDGYIYAGEYEALYCVGCEEYKPQSEIVDGTGEYEGQKVCAIHSKPVELLQEKNYFFRMSEFADTPARPLRGATRLRAARVGAQRGRQLRAPGPQRPVDLAVELRLGHQGAVGRVARRLRLVRRAAQLRHRGRLRPGRRGVRAPLARDAHRRQGHPPLPRGHLAGHAAWRPGSRCRTRSSATAGCSSAARRCPSRS